jgi:hypothetical protein
MSPYTCIAVVVLNESAARLPLYFRYKEPVEPFVEPSALLPLLGHHEGAVTGGLSTLGSRTT